MPKILVVDDDRKIRELLKAYLETEGLQVEAAENADIALEKLNIEKFDLITLDVMMPNKSGVQFAKEIRKISKIPILMLTAKAMVEERIMGLEAGADDYLVKPFDPKELYLRIKNLLGRTIRQENAQKQVKFGEFEFNLESLKLYKNQERIYLSSTEAELLKIFCSNINQPIEREELSKNFNGISERSVDVQITRLRKKFETNPKEPQYLQTAWGMGYVFRI
jgi:two-component system phosphate regulon response regulator OmpR